MFVASLTTVPPDVSVEEMAVLLHVIPGRRVLTPGDPILGQTCHTSLDGYNFAVDFASRGTRCTQFFLDNIDDCDAFVV